jgi:hypothetical protein
MLDKTRGEEMNAPSPKEVSQLWRRILNRVPAEEGSERGDGDGPDRKEDEESDEDDDLTNKDRGSSEVEVEPVNVARFGS